ncbi:hypothetical protein BHE74_00020162 [Ensete ventricosum]|nr:hypothetical protein GW17_00026129 [Ensete ventricosum]RWW72051.1 hypothetical protein BHE74_00020162 [Ensete ventricosum]RZR98773.1 hypothetical protein BHM03_00028199 [Ensete ventricosum]
MHLKRGPRKEVIRTVTWSRSGGPAMAIRLLHVVTALVSTCSRRMSRAATKLSRRRSSIIRKKKATQLRADGFGDADSDGEREEDMRGDVEVWRRTILMGEKCQPLNFSGVIYYDADGRRLSEVPTPRSPLRSPLLSFAQKSPSTADRVT